MRITSIQYGRDDSLIDEQGLPFDGTIAFESDAPLIYIKTKITVEHNGEHYTFYGKGCLCGALSFDQSDVELSQSYAKGDHDC
ncbi:MAG: hypothetical protein JW780_03985 [Clostridiales bacterium]|nr:hypothetical protein [Clostridiales bacterium]